MRYEELTHEERNRFIELSEKSRTKVFNLAYRLSSDRQEAEDLTQEAYFRAYRSFRSYEGDRPFENWIFRIVTRLFLDWNRSKKRKVQTFSMDAPRRADGADDELTIEAADDAPIASEILVESMLSPELEEALQKLQPDQRHLVLMADVEQIPYHEIAAQYGLPVGTVRSRLHRAHIKLRDLLKASKLKPAQ